MDHQHASVYQRSSSIGALQLHQLGQAAALLQSATIGIPVPYRVPSQHRYLIHSSPSPPLPSPGQLQVLQCHRATTHVTRKVFLTDKLDSEVHPFNCNCRWRRMKSGGRWDCCSGTYTIIRQTKPEEKKPSPHQPCCSVWRCDLGVWNRECVCWGEGLSMWDVKLNIAWTFDALNRVFGPWLNVNTV